MKKTVATICLIGSTLALAACASSESAEENELATPYALERTATHEETDNAVVAVPAQPTADKVFQRAQTK
ncbi:MAG: hypothetical protein H6858_05545 [Rhodospirillales bacterium]|nr:hypothetical protein [Alphaproteobacteria bacterium]MCB1838748.1 hypothetical protein [Alphaproteobacteria bacterium]MCB9977039.1 hypothetical protein [Rhodospirillales bacterium]